MKVIIRNSEFEVISGNDLSVGCMVVVAGSKKVWGGKVFKPWTWLKFDTLPIVKPSIDHVAVITQTAE